MFVNIEYTIKEWKTFLQKHLEWITVLSSYSKLDQ